MLGPDAGLMMAVAALTGVGVGCLVLVFMQRRARRARGRRMALLVGVATPSSTASEFRFAPQLAAFNRATQRARGMLRARAELVIRLATLAAIGCAMVGLIGGLPGLFLVAAICGSLIFWLRRESQERNKLDRQAASAFEMLANGLRAGYSIPQAIALVARQSPRPTATEFATAERELTLGSSLADCLARLADRTALADYRLVSIVIWIQSEVGGNLPVVLDAVVATLRERMELRDQVAAVTAQQRMASMVLSLLPLGVLLLFMAVDRTFVDPMFTQTVGRVMLTIAAMLLGAGWFFMRAVSKVEL